MPDLIINGKLFEGVEKLAFDTEDGEKAFYVIETPEVEESNDRLYFSFQPNWLADNSRFAIFTFKDSAEKWYDMELCDNGYYAISDENVTISYLKSNWIGLCICRMSPYNIANNWNNKWNMTPIDNLSVIQDYNLITQPVGTWDNWTPIYSNI